jgi:hypothetical protein
MKLELEQKEKNMCDLLDDFEDTCRVSCVMDQLQSDICDVLPKEMNPVIKSLSVKQCNCIFPPVTSHFLAQYSVEFRVRGSRSSSISFCEMFQSVFGNKSQI